MMDIPSLHSITKSIENVMMNDSIIPKETNLFPDNYGYSTKVRTSNKAIPNKKTQPKERLALELSFNNKFSYSLKDYSDQLQVTEYLRRQLLPCVHI